MKRFLAILCCTCLFLSLSLFGIVTVNAASTEGNYTYSVVNGEAIIKKYDNYNGVRGELVIPSHLGGCPVTEIDSRAFYNNIYLTSVVLPDSVKKIGELASSLENIIEVNIEPYHPLGYSKAMFLNKEYPLKELTFPANETVEEWIKTISLKTKITVRRA